MMNKFVTKMALQKVGLGNVSLPKGNPFGGGTNNAKGANGEGGGGGMANPFANMKWTMPKAFNSWTSPPTPETPVRDPPLIGERAQTSAKLEFPAMDGRPCVILFMRYCGCPFTEKRFLQLRSLANRYTSIHFIAVSHCTQVATDEWLRKLGGAWNVHVVVDTPREIYAVWGLGMSSYAHLLNPRNGYNQIMLGRNEGVWGQEVGEGGCRWQTGGAYAVDQNGLVKWGGPMNSVDEALALETGVAALGL